MNGSHIVKLVLTLIFLLTLQPVGWAQTLDSFEEQEGIEMQWRSNNKSADQLALDIEQLYIVLYNTGNLPIRAIVDGDGRLVESILRTEMLFWGNFFPVGIEAVMCDVNPSVCSRALDKVNASTLTKAADHVGGYKKTRGKWTNQSGSTLYIPDLEMEQYTTLSSVPYPQKQSVESLLSLQDADCSQWQKSCTKVVRQLNQALLDPKRRRVNWPKEIVLPVKRVKTELVFTGTTGSEIKKSLENIGELSQGQILLPTKRSQYYTEEYKNTFKSLVPADVAMRALSPYIPSFGIVKGIQKEYNKPPKKTGLGFNMESSNGSANFFPALTVAREIAPVEIEANDSQLQTNHSLLTLIRHPFDKLGDVPQKYKKQIPVAVLDTWIDKEHCELSKNVELLSEQPQQGSNRPEASKCGDIMSQPPNPVDDHGTHVAGLIAGSPPGQKNVMGLNPFAKLQYIFVDMDQLRGQQYRINIGDKILASFMKNDALVANISWAYTNQIGNDYIKKTIETLTQSMLFVVAAGNSAESRNDICGDRPACLSSFPNVITVIGLDRDLDHPQLWHDGENRGSNWSQKFNIGAIAEDVLSTTYQNYTGRFSGTSQAAPQVTAAASLLFSAYETDFRTDETSKLLPIRAKNRLTYTSDLFGGLLDKVQGGRLNVERALDMANDYVVIEKNGVFTTLRGTLVRFGNNQESEYIECAVQNGRSEQIKREDLRRMFYDETRKKYIIFRNSESKNRDSPLKRIADCRLRTRTHIASIEDDNGEEIEFQFRDIRDFISAMY